MNDTLCRNGRLEKLLLVLLPVLTAIALVVTTVISIVGVKSDFREKRSEKINRAGRVVIVLTIAAALIGLASVVGDALMKRAERQQSAAENADLKLRLEKTLLPIAALKVVYDIDVTRSPIGNGNTGCHPFPLPISKASIPGKWNMRWVNESGIKEAMTPPAVLVFVFKKPVDPQKYKDGTFEREPDLWLSPETKGEWNGVWEANCGKEVGFYDRAINPQSGNGAIQSPVELVGAQLVVIVQQLDAAGGDVVHPKLVRAALSVSGREQSSISDKDWNSYEAPFVNYDEAPGRAAIFAHVLTSEDLKTCCLVAE